MEYVLFLGFLAFVFYLGSKTDKRFYELEKRFLHVQETYNDRISNLEVQVFRLEQSVKSTPDDSSIQRESNQN